MLQGVGAIATAVAAWGAYLQYRDKRYGLSDGEWDILKALQEFGVSRPSNEIEVYLDANEFEAKLNEYPESCGKGSTYGDILLKASRVSEEHWPSSYPLVVPEGLFVSARYRKYCRGLEGNREYLSLVSRTESVEKYELNTDGERFMQKKWDHIKKRYFSGEFVNEVEIMKTHIRSWHELRTGAVVPEFLNSPGLVIEGIEFPDDSEDNPCGVWYLLMIRKDCIDADELGLDQMLGAYAPLKVKGSTIHLLSDGESNIPAGLIYFHIGETWIEMWFGETGYSGHGPDNASALASLEENRKEVLEKTPEKIKEMYYPNGSLVLPKPYWKRKMPEETEEQRKRYQWLRHRNETRLSRFRLRVSEAPSRLWSRLQRLTKRNRAD